MASEIYDPQFLPNHRKDLENNIRENEKLLDKQLFTITTGALVSSVFLIQWIVPDLHKSTFKILLYLGWGFLLLTLIVNMNLYRSNIKSDLETIADIDNQKYNSGIEQQRFNIIGKWSSGIFYLMIAGIILILVYISLNFATMKKITPSTKPVPAPITETRKSSRVVPANTSTPVSNPKPTTTPPKKP